MGAIEPARQAGSTDTKLDQQLDHDGLAVGSLMSTVDIQPEILMRNFKANKTLKNIRMF